MTNHYFSKRPQLESDRTTISIELRGRTFHFISDRGVFSRRSIDFGSKTLIDHFKMPDVEGDLLDMGCGYGPIGLALAAYTKRHVWLIDINERAVELATINAARNQIKHVTILESDGFKKIDKKSFAAIVMNPPIRAGKAIVHHLLEKSFEHLLPNGELWVVVQRKQGAPSIMKKMEQCSLETSIVFRNKGYYVIKSKKIIDL